MKFDLKRACADCPFRVSGAIELREGRLDEIIANLLADDNQWFSCHKTVYARQATGDRAEWSQCVGSMVYLFAAGRPNVAMRIAMSFGLLDGKELFAQRAEFIKPEQDGMPCREQREGAHHGEG